MKTVQEYISEAIVKGKLKAYTNGDFVDLCLPSGTLWAKFNLGAKTVEEQGDYFAWGETKTKTAFTWQNYKYYSPSGSMLQRTSKYNREDKLPKLQIEDDAATEILGEKCKIPSLKDFDELLRNTNQYYVNKDNLKGITLQSKKDLSIKIFLPFLKEANYGEYWTSDLRDDKYNGKAYAFIFENALGAHGSVYPEHMCKGFNIRPIKTK